MGIQAEAREYELVWRTEGSSRRVIKLARADLSEIINNHSRDLCMIPVSVCACLLGYYKSTFMMYVGIRIDDEMSESSSLRLDRLVCGCKIIYTCSQLVQD